MSADGASMTYDVKDGYVVLFGGAYTISAPGFTMNVDENWTWTYHAGVWKLVSPRHSPPARYGAALTYDAADGYVLLQGGGARNGNCIGTCALSDTWKFSAGVWTQLFPSHSPPAAYECSMSYDAHLGRVVFYGGWGSSASPFYNQTWTYLNGSWTHQTTLVAPPATPDVITAYDSRSGSFVAYLAVTPPSWVYRSVVWTLR
jgi:hypothetical protein